MRHHSAAVAALATAALTLGVAGPASAERYGIDDPRDTSHGSDILALEVHHGTKTLKVSTLHQNLRRDPASGSGGAIFIDTDRTNRGPEYVFVGGYYEGTDYQLLETDGFGQEKWGKPVEHGDYIMKIRYDSDRVTVRISQGALGEPGKVRVSVRASGTRTDGSSDGLIDWVGPRRSFSPWLARG